MYSFPVDFLKLNTLYIFTLSLYDLVKNIRTRPYIMRNFSEHVLILTELE